MGNDEFRSEGERFVEDRLGCVEGRRHRGHLGCRVSHEEPHVVTGHCERRRSGRFEDTHYVGNGGFLHRTPPPVSSPARAR